MLFADAWDESRRQIDGAARFRWSSAAAVVSADSNSMMSSYAHPCALTTASDNSFGAVVQRVEGDGPQFTAWLETVYHRPCPLEHTVRVTTEHQRTESDSTGEKLKVFMKSVVKSIQVSDLQGEVVPYATTETMFICPPGPRTMLPPGAPEIEDEDTGSMLARVEAAWAQGANATGNLVRPLESVFGHEVSSGAAGQPVCNTKTPNL